MAFWSVAGPLIGALGAGSQARAQRKAAEEARAAAERAAAQIESAYRPLKETMDWALPAAKDAGFSLIGSRVGKESGILRGQLGETMKEIGREEQRGLAASRQFFGSTGNLGRSRGEQLRTMAGATDARNRARLGYGQAQENYMQGNTDRWMSFLGGMTNLGAQGIGGYADAARIRAQGAASGAQMRADATSGLWGNLAGIAGDLWGQQQGQEQGEKLLGLYREMFGSKPATGGKGKTNTPAVTGGIADAAMRHFAGLKR